MRVVEVDCSNPSTRLPRIVRFDALQSFDSFTYELHVVLQHIERRVTEAVLARMQEVPVVALQGPRSVGKSTVLNEIARQHSARVINLDLPDVRAAVQSDLRRYVQQPGTVFIDEYQRVPEILDVIKAEVDADFRPADSS